MASLLLFLFRYMYLSFMKPRLSAIRNDTPRHRAGAQPRIGETLHGGRQTRASERQGN